MQLWKLVDLRAYNIQPAARIAAETSDLGALTSASLFAFSTDHLNLMRRPTKLRISLCKVDSLRVLRPSLMCVQT